METGRQRLEGILAQRPNRRLSWTTLVDATTRSIMPQAVQQMGPLDFYRHIGCDILQFGNYGLPSDCQVVSPARLVWGAQEEWHQEGDITVRRITSRWGDLTATLRNGHPIKHPVTTLRELDILRSIWRESRYEEVNDDLPERTFCQVEQAIGASGLYVPVTDPSPVQQLIELDMGLEAFYYLLHDHRVPMEELLAAMHRCRLEEYAILARRNPAAAVIPVENTSSTLVSPAVYERYSLPHLSEYARLLHAHGKQIILHMCGRLRHLLPLIGRTGLDGVNGLTPPQAGDVHFEEAMDVLGEDLVILGGIFPTEVFHAPSTTPAQIHRTLDELFTPRLRRAHMLLWVAADGLPTPLERLLAVRDWFDRNDSN
jgi:hypothetical protein